MSKKTIKIYHSCNPHSGYSRWIPNKELVGSVEEADLVFFDGGGDWASELYGEKTHPSSWGYCHRDKPEMEDMMKAIKLGKKMWGTCRGEQGLFIIGAGGRLIQDVSHPGSHRIYTHDGQEFTTSSLHHQIIDPTSVSSDKLKVLAWAENISPFHKNGNDEEVELPYEPELIYLPEIKAIGIQGHPEMMSENAPLVKYCQELLDKLMNDDLDM